MQQKVQQRRAVCVAESTAKKGSQYNRTYNKEGQSIHQKVQQRRAVCVAESTAKKGSQYNRTYNKEGQSV